MKIFVTGVNGQLGHDVVNELVARGHEAVGSDISGEYLGIPDGSAVTAALPTLRATSSGRWTLSHAFL